MISIIITLFSSYNLVSHNKLERLGFAWGIFSVCVFYGTVAKQIELSLVRSLPPRH